MRSTVVIDVVGLTPALLGAHTPNLQRLASQGGMRALKTVTPAVTCTAQSTFLTGLLPREHGIVGNGWYFRDLSEIWFWRQSNSLVGGEKLWDAGHRRDPDFTCANLFWWYNMYSSADIGVTPRPMYPADGRKIPDCYTRPADLRDELNRLLGPFPLFHFWGPTADIVSSQWIGRCALHVREMHEPTLTLVYLPHLDYNLQRLGPDHPHLAQDLRAIDSVCGELMEQTQRDGAAIVVLSEYGITGVTDAVHINRVLREAGMIQVREELGREQLDAGASTAFAVSDHQIAHIYVQRPEVLADVKTLVESLDGVERVLDQQTKSDLALDHPRSGELIAIANSDRWFSYYYWLDDDKAPDFARTVDIHRKPGYDPVELFIDAAIHFPKLSIGWRLAKKMLGFRTLMDVIGLDTSVVKGSHGRLTNRAEDGPLFITSEPALLPAGSVDAASVKGMILDHVFGGDVSGSTP